LAQYLTAAGARGARQPSEIEANASNRDIGFVSKGPKAQIKIDTFTSRATAGLAIFESVPAILHTYLFSHTTNRIDVELGTRVFRHLLALPIAYFLTRRLSIVASDGGLSCRYNVRTMEFATVTIVDLLPKVP
jgi:hypothetical protein